MNKRIIVRLIFSFSAPPLLGAILLVILSVSENASQMGFFDLLFFYGAIAGMAFTFIGIQSFLYAFIMEFAVGPNVRSPYTFVFISSLLGSLTGSTLISFGMVFVFFGCFVGFIVGVCLYKLHRASESHAQQSS